MATLKGGVKKLVQKNGIHLGVIKYLEKFKQIN